MMSLNLAAARGGAAGPSGAQQAQQQGNLLDWASTTFGQGLTAVTKQVKSLISGKGHSRRRTPCCCC